MSTIASTFDAGAVLLRLRQEGRVVVRGMNWETYKTFMDSVGERSLPHAYDGETLELMTKSNEHEFYKCILGRLVEVWADETMTPLRLGGETTLQSEEVQRGVEGDEIYWIGNLERLADPLNIDLARDPPPDLVIEAEVSRTVVNKLGVYAALGVPELWRVTGERIRVGRLQPDGQYQWSEQSALLPGLPIQELSRFLRQAATTSDHLSVLRAFRACVRQLLGR